MQQFAIELCFDGLPIEPKRHCTWDAKRTVPTRDHGYVPAIIQVDEPLGSGEFCTVCWVWLNEADEACPACGLRDAITERKRQIKAWIGIQRYFDQEHYGIDLIRNGRVIEELDKSLFYWIDPVTNEHQLEYPLDATHWGGRIVGELEIDFVRVSHQKDSFDKLDPEWKKVVDVIRGTSPLRPRIAQTMGLGINTSPLGRLYSGYRQGYAGLSNLVPGDANSGQGINDRRIMNWVAKFHEGDPEYQTDEKWYELVLEAEKAVKGRSSRSQQAAGTLPIKGVSQPGASSHEPPGGTSTNSPSQGANAPASSTAAGQQPSAPAGGTSAATSAVEAIQDKALTGTYKLTALPGAPEMMVDARQVSATAIPNGRPLGLDAKSNRVEFRYVPTHSFFEESLDSPLDCLIADLAHRFLLVSGAVQRDWPIAVIERELRRSYFPDTLTSVPELASQARAMMNALREHLEAALPSVKPVDVQLLDPHTVSLVRRGVLHGELGNEQQVQKVIEDGEFGKYVDLEFAARAVQLWPHIALDGQFFSVPYQGVADELRDSTVEMVHDALLDALWLVSDSGGGALNKDRSWRLRLARAVASVRLLQSWRP